MSYTYTRDWCDISDAALKLELTLDPNVQMPSYAQREEWQLAAIESESFEPVKRMGAKFILKRYNACDLANVIFKKRLELVRMVYSTWGASDGKTLVGGSLTGAWVKYNFLYGESVDLLTPKDMVADLVGILDSAASLWREVNACEDIHTYKAAGLQAWAFSFLMTLDTFGLLDILLEDEEIAEFWNQVWHYTD